MPLRILDYLANRNASLTDAAPRITEMGASAAAQPNRPCHQTGAIACSAGSLGERRAKDVTKNLNEDKEWSEMDMFDLRNSFEHGDSNEKIADFLMRRAGEVEGKLRELGLVKP